MSVSLYPAAAGSASSSMHTLAHLPAQSSSMATACHSSASSPGCSSASLSRGQPRSRQVRQARPLKGALFNPLQIRAPKRPSHQVQSRAAGGNVRVVAARQDAFVRVEAGDTLASLAQAFGVSRATFLETNKDLIASENLIFEGDLLRVPAKAWTGTPPPGLEGRVVLRSTRGAGDMLAGVGTALHLLPSYVSLGTPQTTLPAGVGGWLILGGLTMVVFGAVGKLFRGSSTAAPAAPIPESPAPTLPPVAMPREENKLVAEVDVLAYAKPGLPPSMQGPYSALAQTGEALPNRLMQASILPDPPRVKASGAKPLDHSRTKRSAPSEERRNEVEVKTQAQEKRQEEEKKEVEKRTEVVEKRQEVVVQRQEEVELLAAAAVSSPVTAAVESTPIATASAVVERSTAPSVKQRGRNLRDAIFKRDQDTTTFTFASDTDEEDKAVSQGSHNGGAKSPDSTNTWGPYSLGWSSKDEEGGGAAAAQNEDGDAASGQSESAAPPELSAAQKAVQAAVPAVALGLGVVSALTSGWQGAMEAIGLTFVGSFVSYDLLWAEKRDELLKEIKEIRSPADVSKFLEKRGISPK